MRVVGGGGVEVTEEGGGKEGCRASQRYGGRSSSCRLTGLRSARFISPLQAERKHVSVNKHCTVCENPKLGTSHSHSWLHTAAGSFHGGGQNWRRRTLKVGVTKLVDA